VVPWGGSYACVPLSRTSIPFTGQPHMEVPACYEHRINGTLTKVPIKSNYPNEA